MTRNQIRHSAFKALDLVEWLDTHATTRLPKDLKALADKLDDLRKKLLKIIDAPLKTPPLPGPDDD
jgi:hypothetical protein